MLPYTASCSPLAQTVMFYIILYILRLEAVCYYDQILKVNDDGIFYITLKKSGKSY